MDERPHAIANELGAPAPMRSPNILSAPMAGDRIDRVGARHQRCLGSDENVITAVPRPHEIAQCPGTNEIAPHRILPRAVNGREREKKDLSKDRSSP